MRRVGLLVGLAALLVTAAWWMFLISPRNGQIADLEDQLGVALEAETRLRSQIVRLEEIRDAQVQYLAGLGTLETLIPQRPLLDEFIEQIHALTNDTGVVLRTLSPSVPSAASADSELREISVSAQIEGEFFEVLGFLFGLSDLERLVRVDSVAASSGQDEFGDTVLSVSVEMSLFTLADLLPVDLGEADSDPDSTGDAGETEGGDVTGESPGTGSEVTG